MMGSYVFQKEITGKEIKDCRKKLGMTQDGFAVLINVSKKTVERWESGKGAISGPITVLVRLLNDQPQIAEYYSVPEQGYPLRLCYMFREEICTVIDVDEAARRVKIYNYTKDPFMRAFGTEDTPGFEEYEEFLESRCFPRSRDKMKLVLEDLGLPFYDPFLIIEKTQGRMAEDEFWLKIERRGSQKQ